MFMCSGLAYDAAMLKHTCICQNNAVHPENPARLNGIWNRFSAAGLVEKCKVSKLHLNVV